MGLCAKLGKLILKSIVVRDMTDHVAFRVDASHQIGGGHMMRCLALAESFRQSGWEITFLSRNPSENWLKLFRKNNIGLVNLTVGESADNDSEQLADAIVSIHKIKSLKNKPKIVILDHYGLGGIWEKKVKSSVEKLIVIDDLAAERHTCDVLINYGATKHTEKKYENLLSSKTKLLTGHQYTILSPQYRKARPSQAQVSTNKEIRNLAICYGSSDLTNETEKVLEAIHKLNNKIYKTKVIVGPTNKLSKELRRWKEKISGLELYYGRVDLANILAGTEMAFCSASCIMYELMCLSVAVTATVTADNQKEGSISLAEDGLITYLGESNEVTVDMIQDELENLSRPSFISKKLNKSAKAYLRFDGLGTERIFKSVSV